MRLLTTIAGSLGTALENARLFDETQRLLEETRQRNNELAIINTIQQGLASELDFQAIIDLVGDKLREVFASPDLSITWYDEKQQMAYPLYCYEQGERLTLPSRPILQGDSFEKLSRTRQPLVWGTEEEGDAISPLIPGTSASKSGVMVPIISSDRLIGRIDLENFDQEHAYGAAELRLLTTVAGTLGAALENAHLFEETQRLLEETRQRNGELAILNSIQQGLAAELDFQAIVDLVGDNLRQIFNVNDIGIAWHDEKANLMHQLYTYEHGKRLIINPVPPLKGGLFETLATQRQPIVYNSPADHTEINISLVPGTDPSKSSVYVPIISSNRVLGLIYLDNFERENAYGEAEVRLLTTIAGSLGTALENARLFDETQSLLEETRQRNDELAIINTIQQGLASSLDFQGIVDLVGDSLRKVFNTDDFSVRWYDEKTNLLHHLYEYDHGQRLTVAPHEPPPNSILSRMLVNRGVVSTQTMTLEEWSTIHVIPGTERSKSFVYVPIVSADHLIGMIGTENYEREDAFGDAETRLLTTIAASLGTALENARLFNETQRLLQETTQRNNELAIINEIQRGLASKLDLQSIIDLVGENVRKIFTADGTVISLYDSSTRMLNTLYQILGEYREHEETHPLEPSLTARVIETRQPLLVGTMEEAWRLGQSFRILGPILPTRMNRMQIQPCLYRC